jgi:hypothetical protein
MSIEKISDNHFSRLQDIKNEAVEIASTLGELEYQKISTDLKIEEQKEKIKILKAKEAKLFEELTKIHGNVVINIETGAFTSQETVEDNATD